MSVGRPPAPQAGDGGTATVYACVGVVALLMLTGLAVHLGAVVLARQRAENGADLAALAGAAQVLRGADVACAAAIRVAQANDVSVEDCTVVGFDLLVQVSSGVGGAFGGSATGRARAGPIEPVGSAADHPATREAGTAPAGERWSRGSAGAGKVRASGRKLSAVTFLLDVVRTGPLGAGASEGACRTGVPNDPGGRDSPGAGLAFAEPINAADSAAPAPIQPTGRSGRFSSPR